MTTETRSLHRKLAQVMYEADRIPKNGTAPAAMGGFKFVQVGDAADVIRKALAEKGVSMIPTAIELVDSTEHATSSGKSMTTMTVRTTWTLTDGESGESTVIQSLGSGADMGDKAAPKAQSNAMKYALLMGFLLSTGDDPELSDSSDRQGRQTFAPPAHTPPPPPAADRKPDGSLIGTAELGSGVSDFELRQGPKGGVISFRLRSGRQTFKVIAEGPLADELRVSREDILGKLVTCWGRVSTETFDKKRADGTTYKVEYEVLTLERLSAGDLLLPAEDRSAPSVPAFDDSELDAAMARVP